MFTLITVDYRAGDGTVLRGLRTATAAVFGPVQRAVTSVVRPIGNALAGPLAEATSWTDNVYVASDRRLGDVITDVQRWYRTQIFAVDPAILDRRISIRASLDSVRQAISAIEREGNVQFGYLNDKMIFSDRQPAPARKAAR